MKMMMNLQMKMMMNTHQSRNCSEPSSLVILTCNIRHKEDQSLPGMQIYFMVIFFIVLTLDIRFQIKGIIKEMFKQTVETILKLLFFYP